VSLLVRIAELLILYTVVRSVIRMLLPAKSKHTPPGPKQSPAPRFDGKEYDISDADYEEVE
jgi:hypothetical protein